MQGQCQGRGHYLLSRRNGTKKRKCRPLIRSKSVKAIGHRGVAGDRANLVKPKSIERDVRIAVGVPGELVYIAKPVFAELTSGKFQALLELRIVKAAQLHRRRTFPGLVIGPVSVRPDTPAIATTPPAAVTAFFFLTVRTDQPVARGGR